jgi:error-prone DNA polymerase
LLSRCERRTHFLFKIGDRSPPAEMPLDQQVNADYEATGLSLKAHPLGLVRSELDKLQVLSASALRDTPDKAMVRVAGLVLVRQQPSTSKGTIFITLEDETGTSNLVIWPRVWQRYRQVGRAAVALLAQGKIERSGSVIHVIVSVLEYPFAVTARSGCTVAGFSLSEGATANELKPTTS